MFLCLPDIITVLKSRMIELEGYLARMRDITNEQKILLGNPKGRNKLGNLHVYGRVILNLTLGN